MSNINMSRRTDRPVLHPLSAAAHTQRELVGTEQVAPAVETGTDRASTPTAQNLRIGGYLENRRRRFLKPRCGSKISGGSFGLSPGGCLLTLVPKRRASIRI